MAQTYKTGLIITGDASGGIRAIKATEDELGKLNQGFDRGGRRSKQFTQNINGTSRELQVLRRAAAPIAGVIAGMFAANSLQNQINWGDQLQKTNLRIGASTEALSQYNYVAKLSGVEFGQLTTAWQRQTRRIAEAAAGTGVAVAALDRLNLSAQELNQLAPEDQFERIAAAMQGVENSSERVRLAQQLWDSEGVKLVQIVNQGTGAMAAMRAEADALGLTISQDTANAMASYNDEVDRLKFAAQGVSQTLLAEMVPAMTAGLQETNAFIQQVGGAEVVVGHLIDGGKVLAALMGGRYAGAFATATAAKLAATQQSIAYQMALARMAGVSATAAGAQASLAAATRGAGAAMALVGGPLGAAMIAGGAIYYFREELGLVAPKVQSATDRVDDMTSALDANSEAALKNARAMLEAERQFQQFRQSTLAMEVSRQQQVVADEQRQWDAVGGQQAFGMGMRSEAQQKLHDLRLELLDTRQAIEAAGGSVSEIDEKLEELERTTRDIIPPTTELGDATETAAAKAQAHADAADAQAAALEELRNRLIPGRRETVQLAQDTNTLALAMAMGRGNTVQLIQMMGQLQQEYIEGQRETDNLATASEDASQRIANNFLSWETVADNTLRRVDDSGQGLWLGLIDGSESALDTVKRGFQQTLAEIAHMLTTQRLTFHVAGMMGLDTTGMPGGGGLNFNALGSLGRSASSLLGFGGSAAAPSLAMQGGLSSAALASASQVASGATYGGALGSAASGAALGNVASGGIMSSITAGVSAAMPWIAGGLAIDSLLGGGITKAISGLFGGGKTNPHLNIDTRANDSYGHGSVREGAFGAVGFAQGTRRSNDLFGGIPEEREFLAAIAASDDLLASLARSPEELQAMAEAVQGVRLSASNVEGVVSQLSRRTVAAVSAMDGEFGEFVASIGTDVDTIIARTQNAVAALDLLSGASDRLNLQFDASAAGALRAADSIAQMAGGVDQLASLQDSYYTAFFSDAERAADLQQDVAASLREMGLALPSTHEGFRQLVEQQNRLTESGQRNYVQLLQLAGPFDQLQTLLEQTGNGVDVFADRLSQLNGEISTLENEVRNAYAAFEKQSFDQQLQLLGLLGDEQTALALQRERELQGIDPLLHETQRRIWAMEDEAAAQKAATQAGQEYARSLAQVNDQLSSTFNGISQWVDQQTATAGTPGMNLTEAGDQFARQLVLAQSGDRNALQSITQYAEQYLAAGEAMYASGGAFQRIQGDVLDALKDLPDQISAEEYLAQEIRDALQSVVISAMPTDERLAVELSRELTRLDANQLTAAQVRSALAPHATDAEISRLIREVDANGDGIITKQELANQRLAGLASGIGSTLKPMFDSIDLDASGLIDWNEFYGAFQGLASDAELRRIFRQLDEDGSGTISRLEALNRSSEGTEGNTQSLEERARDQLSELGGLVEEMGRTTDQFVGLNGNLVSLKDSINALGVAQAEVARIERERKAAEQAERDRIARERELSQQRAAIRSEYEQRIQDASYVDPRNQGMAKEALAAGVSGWHVNQRGQSTTWNGYQASLDALIKTVQSADLGGMSQRDFERWVDQQEANATRNGGGDWTAYYFERVAEKERARQMVEVAEEAAAALRREMEKALKRVDGSHATGLWSVPFDNYVANLHRDEMVVPAKSANLLRELPDRGLPMPDVPLPQFPQLGNSDVVQVLNDLRNENKQLRQDLNRLLGDVKANTANTANAVASSATRAEQQRAAQLDEQRAATSAARVKGRTV
ncbi:MULTISPECIES: EF-hand domain-containing protein [unclassified Halomonas]|uniref:EF-hand domain-containing protein n=1 Tax=unclassified Halomonas TaxID=2609666 RepID=UPI001EF444C8|nr:MULTISPECIES: EF-hand domain-containing protein [unclassified Halomonas]MCG7589670.1 EF-hand domain-containing protein [Halomonas sp. McD50-5]MCG7616281.1 EF-hand domain-containing protein [Halomonas sp. McD50-4]